MNVNQPVGFMVALLAIAAAGMLLACTASSRRASTTDTPNAPASVTTSTPLLPAPIRTVATPDRFYSAAFVSPQVGWASGDRGIVSTTDGGVHWTPQFTEPRDAVMQLDFIDARTGFALEPIPDVAGGGHSGGVDFLLYTTDGGGHWDARRKWTPVRFTDIAFATSLTGWAIGYQDVEDHAGTLYRTNDGGESWSAVFSPAQSVCFDDPNVGWVAASGAVKRTVDGGATWTTSFTNPVANEGDKVWGGPVECKSTDVAWLLLADGVAASHQAYFVFRTVDGGSNTAMKSNRDWQPVMRSPMGPRDFPIHVAVGVYPGPVSVVDANDAFVVGTCAVCGSGTSTIEATHDGGLSWGAPVEIPGAGAGSESLSFVDREHGWLATSKGIFATTDGGLTWTRQLPR